MKKQFAYLFVVFIALLLIVKVSAKEKIEPINVQDKILNVQVNTADGSIKVNGTILKSSNQDFTLKNIEKIIGKPDRIKTNTYMSHYERFGSESPKTENTIVPIEVTDYYYIYDKLGIMFYTKNNGFNVTKEPQEFSIHFDNKRMFTNTASLSFSPVNPFKGALKINNETVQTDKKIIPTGVNYKTEEFNLFSQSFASTSIGGIIDGLYSKNSEPYIFFFLDTEKDQRISYVTIK